MSVGDIAFLLTGFGVAIGGLAALIKVLVGTSIVQGAAVRKSFNQSQTDAQSIAAQTLINDALTRQVTGLNFDVSQWTQRVGLLEIGRVSNIAEILQLKTDRTSDSAEIAELKKEVKTLTIGRAEDAVEIKDLKTRLIALEAILKLRNAQIVKLGEHPGNGPVTEEDSTTAAEHEPPVSEKSDPEVNTETPVKSIAEKEMS